MHVAFKVNPPSGSPDPPTKPSGATHSCQELSDPTQPGISSSRNAIHKTYKGLCRALTGRTTARYLLHNTKEEGRHEHQTSCEYDEAIKIFLSESGDEGSSSGCANQARDGDEKTHGSHSRAKLFN